MLLTLNEDCLQLIFDFLDPSDLLLLSYVCRDLQNLAKERLRRTCKRVSFFTKFWREDKNEKYLQDFITTVSSNLENLEISGNCIAKNEQWLHKLNFSKVTILYISLRKLSYEQEDILQIVSKLFPNVIEIKISGEDMDNAIEMIADFYPNLKKISLFDKCSGESISKLKNVQELYIHTGSDRFNTKLFCLIASAPQLKSLTFLRNFGFAQPLYDIRNVDRLQQLTIHNLDFENLKRANAFKLMKSLRKLTTYEYPLHYTIELDNKHFYCGINSFSISRRYSKTIKVIIDAPNLRRLWFNREADILPDFCASDSKTFYKLEELCYINSRAVEETQESVICVLSRSPKLRLLDISGTKFGVGFIENVMRILKLKNHTNELILRCYNTKIKKEDLVNLELPRNLKISFQKVSYDLPTRNIINFQIYFEDQFTSNS